MVNAPANLPDALAPAALDALAARAWPLRPPAAFERRHVLRPEAGLLLDGLLARVARSRGALDVAIGDGLAALSVGDGTLRLGFSGIGDYARERLGISARTAQGMARLARELRDRPHLAAAVRAGELSARKAQAILPVARGAEEAAWVARARTETVRALEAAAREASAAEPPEDEEWERLTLSLEPAERATLDEAMALAGRVLGAAAPRWQRLEAICQEYLSAHPDPAPEGNEVAFTSPLAAALDAVKADLEEEHRRWEYLAAPPPAPAPEVPGGGSDVVAGFAPDCHALDARLRELVAMRNRWDELVGHLAMLFKSLDLWRDAGFASFSHYCTERLGLSGRAVEQRAWLERRLHALPPLRAALRDGRVSYEQARLVAGAADEHTVDALIARAEGTTCIALRRALDAEDDAQMCAAGAIALRLPSKVTPVVQAALRAARAAAGGWIRPGACLARVARHFVDTWKDALRERRTVHRAVLDRDRERCQVPGCSRAADHAHHVRFRSHGGTDDPSNLVALCAAHHLHGVHRGFLRVRGEAPDRLTWELGPAAHEGRSMH